MLAYILRRLLYAVPILVGVNLLTFALFFVVNTPDDMARMQLGVKRVTPEAIAHWKAEHGYDKPLLINGAAQGAARLTETVFFEKSVRMFVFDFGRADDGRDIANEIRTRMGPSLAIALPTFVLGLFVTIAHAGGFDSTRFLVLPVAASLISGVGTGTRWYRTIFLEEINRDYVRTARAKGLSELRVLFGHVLRNAMIPILTGVVVVIPTLFLGSLITESFFGIPGLGSYTIEAIRAQDFSVVRAMVFIGSVLYIAGLLLTDISYTLADPRVRLE